MRVEIVNGAPPPVIHTPSHAHRSCRLSLLGWALGLLLASAPVVAQEAPDSTATQVDLGALSCDELETVFYQQVPRDVYDDQPDQLYELVLLADERCDFGEAVGRIRILASIWDGSFDEAIYGFEVIGWLVDRYDPAHQPAPDTDAAYFNEFTTNFADQLLPHVAAGSLEEFFCLYYSGQTAIAWKLLQSEALEDTWLRYYYDEEIGRLERRSAPYTVTAHWGLWTPRGNQEFVGQRQLVGGTVEQRWSRWFGRAVLEFRLGRADAAYFVDKDGVSGFSDRWDAVLMGVEGGRSLWRSGPHLLDLFVGLGYDAATPFRDEQVVVSGFNVSLGAGYRLHLNRSRRWFVGVDGRWEWVSERNPDGTPLGGTAFSGRVGLGFSLGRDPAPRLKALGQGS